MVNWYFINISFIFFFSSLLFIYFFQVLKYIYCRYFLLFRFRRIYFFLFFFCLVHELGNREVWSIVELFFFFLLLSYTFILSHSLLSLYILWLDSQTIFLPECWIWCIRRGANVLKFLGFPAGDFFSFFPLLFFFFFVYRKGQADVGIFFFIYLFTLFFFFLLLFHKILCSLNGYRKWEGNVGVGVARAMDSGFMLKRCAMLRD